MGFLCKLVLLTLPLSALVQSASVGDAPVKKTKLQQRATAPSASPNLSPQCFSPPDREHHVGAVVPVCRSLFQSFLDRFGNKQDMKMIWSGNNKRWSEKGVVHLPKIQYKINDNNTEACLLEITDFSRAGDTYTPASVITAGREILTDCFSRNLCGEVPLGPDYTTGLAICATIHRKPDVDIADGDCIFDPDSPGCLPLDTKPAATVQTATKKARRRSLL